MRFPILTRARGLAKAILLALGFTWGLLGTAWAQQPPTCGPYERIVAVLRAEPNGEMLIGMGTADEGKALLQIFVNPKTRTWTVVKLNAQAGIACIADVGQNWILPSVEEERGKQGAPS